jgi:pimeloyl-ACP methyl ester carboxylesterase
MQTHADDLAAFITALRLDRVAIVGHSYGGSVSLVMATSHPELVDRLFLYEFSPFSLSTFVEGSDDFSRATEEYLEVLGAGKAATNRGDTDAAVEMLMDGVNGVGSFQRLPHSVRSMMRQNGRTLPLLFAAPPAPSITREDLAKLDFPTSFAVGEDTRALYKMVSKAASQYLPGSKFIEVPNARHLWLQQDPAAFSRLVLDFLNDC